MATDHELRVHRDWIGLLQPVGLVVSPPALLAAQAFPDKNILKEQQALLALITPPALRDAEKKPVDRPPLPLRFEDLATQVLGWKASKLAGGPNGAPLPETLELVLPEFGETLRPTYAVPALKEDDAEWLMLVQELPDGTSFDEPPAGETKKWHASPQIRLERLLRETRVPMGILANGRFLRLVYAPSGESSGHVTWPVHRLCTALDRDMLSALCMLLGSARLFTLPREQRLPQILKESRKYQNVVSTKLAGQVLEALNELLRGFQSANEAAKGGLLDATVREDPDHVYGGLLAVLLRLVFILYAEERGLLSSSATYVRNYALVGLFEKLRIDAGRFPDTMDQRYGAWSRLLVLFRMVHDGAKRGDLRLPPRYGHLFDPDGWAFLEGRPLAVSRVLGAPVQVPKVPDGVVLRVLEKLLLLDTDRLSYRALDVEQIGSVYENMMGFRLERAIETSIGIGKEHVVVGLQTLLGKKAAEREKHLKETTNVELSGKAVDALKAASTVDDLVAALSRRISPLTPRTIPTGGLYLQPTDERRRSGSHYTPRELTEPIVRTTLRPIVENLGTTPRPEQLLALKVCDPAMGSGAFLVETCRQLAEQLEKAYDVHGRPTDIPPDEDVRLYAQRQVAQHCLYGVDKNPFAVDLGKLSLWLATLARDHAFTFLDHSIRHGDSLVGLSREQIASFNWTVEHGLKQQIPLLRATINKAIGEALALREKIPDLANSDDVFEKQRLLREADATLAKMRIVGDAVVAIFLSEDKTKARETARESWQARVQTWLSGGGETGDLQEGLVQELHASGEKSVPCFHWQLEFPEVFALRGGFDAIVGNPPYLNGTRISTRLGDAYRDYITSVTPGTNAKADLVAFFVRRGFTLLRAPGAMGLVTTQTISMGDTRPAALGWIVGHGGHIFSARRRIPWPGKAAVTAAAIHVLKGPPPTSRSLNGKNAQIITSFLFDRGPDDNPASLNENEGLCFSGPYVMGAGFLFDDDDPAATPVKEMHRLLAERPALREVIRPYIGGEEFLNDPNQQHSRYVIYLGELDEAQARAQWPEAMDILAAKARPERASKNAKKYPRMVHEWWKFWNPRHELMASLRRLDRAIMTPFTAKHLCFGFVPAGTIVGTPHVVFCTSSSSSLGVLQSRIHEVWVAFFGSNMDDRQRYTPTDCFEGFPAPVGWMADPAIGAATNKYLELRGELTSRTAVGLTDLYNRFHDPDERDPDIARLRDLRAAMDRTVLDAYHWNDIQPTCEFLLDYEEDDDDAESGGGRRKKKPWRYRWPDELRDEVLARLLELNAERANEQSKAAPREGVAPGGRAKKAAVSPNGAKRTTKMSPENQGKLFKEEGE